MAEHITIRADLNSESGPDLVTAAALEHFGRIDGLINNAGIQPIAPLIEMIDEEFREMIETNLTSVHRLTKAVATVHDSRWIDRSCGVDRGHPAGPQPRPLRGRQGGPGDARKSRRARMGRAWDQSQLRSRRA